MFDLFCVCMCLQSHRSTAQSTVRATCAAGLPVSWEQTERVKQTSRTAPTSAAWWQWDGSTPIRLPRSTGKCESNQQSLSRAMPWMANSPLLIKGRIRFQWREAGGGGIMNNDWHMSDAFHWYFQHIWYWSTDTVNLNGKPNPYQWSACCIPGDIVYISSPLQSDNHSWLSSSRTAWDIMLRVLSSRWPTTFSRQTSKR